MTHPTRLQQQARDRFAEALLAIVDAARGLPTGPRSLDAAAIDAIADRLAGATGDYAAADLLAIALDRRARSLGLSATTVEFLPILIEGQRPAPWLLIGDDDFRDRLAALEAEALGDDHIE